MATPSRLMTLAIARLSGLSLQERVLLAGQLDCSDDLGRLSRRNTEGLIGRRLREGIRWNPRSCVQAATADAEYLSRGIGGWLSWFDPLYPRLLREIHDPPFGLFYRGVYAGADAVMLAVVGTRHPTGAGLSAAFELGMNLAASGVPICSGLAMGIDRAAHEGCLSGGARCVAVLGNGIDSVYPVSSRRVANHLLDADGCILSEYPPGTAPARHHFPARNRIISGLSLGVVVVQAPARSGALITVDFALDQGRDVFVHADGMVGLTGAGSCELERAGAPVVRRAADLLAYYGITGEMSRTVFRQITATAASSGRSDRVGRAMATLLEDEQAGRVVRFRERLYRRKSAEDCREVVPEPPAGRNTGSDGNRCMRSGIC